MYAQTFTDDKVSCHRHSGNPEEHDTSRKLINGSEKV